ncbi:porin family protein [Ginsengibacter hankyongi]|uniref:Porin family protein n=1 Tax=Ginsengibacter hankyongi TaxID=2607284 RepID=A0A5J5ID27_9BACT|nr:outer membrane beta-barrel protein [Ginsengibacter hankyongi]KAA9035941.1 porin family protein [Ginsengibacter hankyongi]
METKVFATITLLVLFLQSNAQSEKNKFIFGIKGGYNHTVINGYETNGAKTGFIGSTVFGSLFGERGISENKFLSAEFTYSWVNDWNFVEIPFHFRQMLNRQISIFAGPKLDVAADKIDKSKESTSRLLGISAEAGAQYDFSHHLFGEVKYSVGVTENFNDVFFDINNGKRDNFRIGAGYRF